MNRIRALFLKELEEHGLLLVLLALGMGAVWLALAGLVLLAPATVTHLEAHATFMRFFLPLGAIGLGNRLVVSELQQRTRLFVEALPIPGYALFAVKFVLGSIVLLVLALGSLTASCVLALTREPIDGGFVALLAVRTGVFACVLWAYFFVMGFLGRFRIPIFVVSLGLLMYLSTATAFETSRFGPFALVYDNDFAVEREAWPKSAILWSAALTLVFSILAFVLSTIHEGSVAESLARRMSAREKVVLGAVAFAFIVTWMKLDPPATPARTEWGTQGVVRSSSLPIFVRYLDADAQRAVALVDMLERELAPLPDVLGWTRLPELRVAFSSRLDGRTIEKVPTAEDDGVELRVNPLDESFRDERLLSEAVARLVDAHTRGRSRHESRAWVRDGLAEFWPHRDREAPSDLVLRALFAVREHRLDLHVLNDWQRTSEVAGADVARALAATMMFVLREERGVQAVWSLGRELFSRRAADDSRLAFQELFCPLGTRIEGTAGMSRERWVDHADRFLGDARNSLADRTARLPDAHAELIEDDGSWVARVQFRRPLPPGATLALLHRGVGAFDDVVEETHVSREERALDSAESLEWTIEVPPRYGQGQRVWAAVDVISELGGFRLAQDRLTIGRLHR